MEEEIDDSEIFMGSLSKESKPLSEEEEKLVTNLVGELRKELMQDLKISGFSIGNLTDKILKKLDKEILFYSYTPYSVYTKIKFPYGCNIKNIQKYIINHHELESEDQRGERYF